MMERVVGAVGELKMETIETWILLAASKTSQEAIAAKHPGGRTTRVGMRARA